MTESTPLISVVIPTFNRADIILKTLNSVLQQTYRHIEVFVVDDASTDATAAVMAGVQDERVRFIQLEKNSGGTRPRNEGIERSNGEFIALLDSDDEWVPEKLEKQLHFLQQQPGRNRVCMTAKYNKRPEGLHLRRNKALSNYASIMEFLLLGNDFQTSTLLLDAAIAKQARFDPTLRKHQDWDFALRLQEQGASFYYLDLPLTIYDDSDSTARISSDGKRDKSLIWLESIKKRVPSYIWFGFYAKIIADSYLLSNQKGKGIAIYLKLLLSGKIKFSHFMAMMNERIKKLATITAKRFVPGK
ncbi:glycosyltransferase family 2 protein [Mixta tenebrionis]|uniref:Glycosyltransferase family 2 protein n=1 Tax=Mixta tenebrionis TaxID=2562439 RepID=A0A506VCK6_9GAMM|nr:glycosyltransferase family 2 protein [Mixta tenebrionis]TPW42723.1 glycosyltransferase family 2 protein [Mixta tenebrionis]